MSQQNREIKCHQIDLIIEDFEAVIDEVNPMKFLICKDEGYEVDDRICMRELVGSSLTGNTVSVGITYITNYMQADGWLVLGLG